MEDDDDDLLLACSMYEETSKSTHKKTAKVFSSFKSQDSWISSSFGDFGDFGSKSSSKTSAKAIPPKTQDKQPRKRAKTSGPSQASFPKPFEGECELFKKKDSAQSSGDLWADKYQPACQADLAVHKKKIAELEDWLRHSLSKKHKLSPLLLLTGPAGAGKTATLRVLAREMSIEIQEWTNPVTDAYDSTDNWKIDSSDYRPVGGSMYVSQTAQFQDFLLRANRYPSLQIFNQDQLHKKIIMVEEFPNVFFRNTAQFHDILRSYQQRGHGPMVFIVSDSAGGDSNERLLFPKHVQEELCVANISFNPVAPTSLSKILTKLATAEASRSVGRYLVPSKSTIDALSAASAGDIRGAINALQFACLKDTRDLDDLMASTSQPTTSKKTSSRTTTKKSTTKAAGGKTRKKKSADEDSALAAIGGRDTSLFLFRALGKILYCKRGEPADFPETVPLPPHYSQHHRDPLLIHPEEVIEKAQLSGEYFTAYLHQNYLDFYTSLGDVISASEYFSDADHLTTDWATRSSLRDYSASVAARGVMFCNSARAASSAGGKSGLGWKPLHKPKSYDVTRKCRRNREASRDLFIGSCSTPDELHMNYLPYVTLTKTKLEGSGQMYFVKEFNKFDNKQYQRERLDEDDVGLGDSDNEDKSSQAVSSSQPAASEDQVRIGEDVKTVEEEEVEIEDFED